ncbi:MAG: hypothetical protein PHC43_01625 [Candidatus Marinimicrobia bacterium]|nr:hypothetical protein [Candidatus Neomarinimicrobiota bacterium]
MWWYLLAGFIGLVIGAILMIVLFAFCFMAKGDDGSNNNAQ